MRRNAVAERAMIWGGAPTGQALRVGAHPGWWFNVGAAVSRGGVSSSVDGDSSSEFLKPGEREEWVRD
jgi:hypothetical protein